MSPEAISEESSEGHRRCGGAITAPRRTWPAIGPRRVVRLARAPNAGSTKFCVWWVEKRTRRGKSGEGSPEEDKDGGVGGLEFIFKRCDSSWT